MFINSIDEEYYNTQMEQMKQLVQIYHQIRYSDTYYLGLRYKRIKGIINQRFIRNLRNYWVEKKDSKRLDKLREDIQIEYNLHETRSYFSNEKIAVYTCVFGNYDHVYEPICNPNNIDYYIFTDCNITLEKSSCWNKVDLSNFNEIIEGMTNIEKNRWFKMHAKELFGERYRYSVYIDGNVQPITDFTELVNKIGPLGIGMYGHKYNDCVYQEALTNIYQIKKAPQKDIEEQIRYLKMKEMPSHFGMTTCNVIARDHSSAICEQIMDEWWKEFTNRCKRDQLSFPYVVWKLGYRMQDVAVLGLDVWGSDALIIHEHK